LVFSVLCPTGSEEFAKQVGTFVGEDAPAYGEAVVKGGRGDVDDGAAAAELRVGGAVNDAVQARQDRGESAHGAWLDRYVKRAPVQAPVAHDAAGFAERFQFGVCYRLAGGLGSVSAAAYYPAFRYDYGSDGDFALGGGFGGGYQRLGHESFVLLILGHSVRVSFAFDYAEII
jgi:hypothetical protein